MRLEWVPWPTFRRWLEAGDGWVGYRQLLTTRVVWLGPLSLRLPWER